MSDAPLHIFVDEAGDTTLFGRHGKVLIGEEGTSSFFIVGRLEVDDTKRLADDLDRLRAELLADLLLKSVPSMDPMRGKTARFFHAKDDLPEVRLQVFRLLYASMASVSQVWSKTRSRFLRMCANVRRPKEAIVTRPTVMNSTT